MSWPSKPSSAVSTDAPPARILSMPAVSKPKILATTNKTNPIKFLTRLAVGALPSGNQNLLAMSTRTAASAAKPARATNSLSNSLRSVSMDELLFVEGMLGGASPQSGGLRHRPVAHSACTYGECTPEVRQMSTVRKLEKRKPATAPRRIDRLATPCLFSHVCRLSGSDPSS